MHLFFVKPEQIQGRRVKITGSDVNHIRNVLRLCPGDEISISNGVDGREYRCGVEAYEEGAVLCTLRFVKEADVELPVRVTLFQCLPKAGKMDWIVMKAVELGASEIVPVASERCVVKLDGKKAADRVARWQEIAREAAKQSRRGIVPSVKGLMSFKRALSYASGFDCKLIPYEMAKGIDETRKQIGSILPGQRVAIFIGPEGGFCESEIEAAKESGFHPITLGRRILRTETAGMTVLAWLIYQLEEDPAPQTGTE